MNKYHNFKDNTRKISFEFNSLDAHVAYLFNIKSETAVSDKSDILSLSLLYSLLSTL